MSWVGWGGWHEYDGGNRCDIGWFVGGFVGRFGWLICWLFGWFVDRLHGHTGPRAHAPAHACPHVACMGAHVRLSREEEQGEVMAGNGKCSLRKEVFRQTAHRLEFWRAAGQAKNLGLLKSKSAAKGLSAQNQLLRCSADAASKSAKSGIGESSSGPLLRPTAAIRCRSRTPDADADADAGAGSWQSCESCPTFAEIRSVS